MKTTLNIPDELYRELKLKAVREGVPVTELVVEGLRMAAGAELAPKRKVQFPLVPTGGSSPKLSTVQVKKALLDLENEEDLRHAQPRRR